MIDFGLAKKFIDERTGEVIPLVEGKEPVGAPRYRACNCQRGLETSRRDDCESILFMLIEMALDGDLPWVVKGAAKIDHVKVLQQKEGIESINMTKSLPP